MADSVRWGILGTGSIAHKFVTDLKQHGHTVAAVGSRTAQRAEAMAEEFSISEAHGSYDELAADPGVDIIYVATPHPFHAEHAMLALSGGKHAFVEKPFTLNASQAQQVVTLAKDRGLLVMEAMWTRFLPHMERLRHIVREGLIGDVRTVLADHNQILPKDPSNRIYNPHLGGGALLDLGIYPLSLAWDLLGPPETVTARATMTETGVDRQVAAICEHANGAQSVSQAALDSSGTNTAAVLGTAGRVELTGFWYTAATTLTRYDESGEEVEHYAPAVSGRGMQLQAVAAEACIAEGSTVCPIIPPEESVGVMTTLDEIRRQIGFRYPSE